MSRTDAQRVTPAEAELINAGFRPKRFAFITLLIRRVLWPFIRPFHFYTLSAVMEIKAEHEKLAEEIRDRLVTSFSELHHLHKQVSDLAGGRMQMQSDVIAAVNRLNWLEEHSGAIAAPGLKSSDELCSRLAKLELEYSSFSDKLRQETRPRLLRLENENSNLLSRLGILDDRSRELTDWCERLTANEHSTMVHVDTLAASLQDARQAEGLFLTTLGDNVVLLKAGELISETVRRTGEWDPHIVSVGVRAAAVIHARTVVPSKLVAIDVGAHFGLITLGLAPVYDEILSFEPNSFNASLLRANVLLNDFATKVKVRAEAVGASDGHMSLAPAELQEIPLPLDEQGRLAPRLGTNLGAYVFVENGTGLNSARAISLDSLALDETAFIKIDVQGGDGAVLTGAMNTIARCRPWIAFEWEEVLSGAFGITLEKVKSSLCEMSYETRVLHRHNAKQVDYLALPTEEAWARPHLKEALA